MVTRTKNGTRNIAAGFLNKLVQILLPFFARTVFIYTLGSEYLGLSSLFSSILMVLNLSELGFGSALVFSMYRPIAENNKTKICALLSVYKKIYLSIGVIILIVGLALIPFLPYLIKGGIPSGINIYYLYLLYLGNTVISYFIYAHRKALLIAYQRSDVISNINTIATIALNAIQIVILFLTHNFYLYVLIYFLFTIIESIWAGALSKKFYPSLDAEGNITVEDKKAIGKHVKGIALQQICSTSRNTMSSIVISSFLGLSIVTIYGNYFMILASIHAFLYQIPHSIKATVGNSIASESLEKNYKDFSVIYLVYLWISGWCATCLVCLYQPFMRMWMGEELMFPMHTVILLCLYFIILSMADILALYKDAAGLWWYGRYRVVIEAISNIILTILFGYLWGINGILLAPILTMTIIGHGYGGWIVFNYYFKAYNFFSFILKQLLYLILIACISAFTLLICNLIYDGGAFELILRGVVCLIVPNAMYYVVFKKFREFNYAKEMISRVKNSFK